MHIIIHDSKDFKDNLEIVLHQDEEYVYLTPKDNDHANLIVYILQHGIMEQVTIDDRR